MIVKTEDDIRRLVESDQWMMDVLSAAEKLNLPDWWIGGGFLRNKVWNAVSGIDSHSDTDVDLSYFNANDTKPETDWLYDERMSSDYPNVDWEIRNQSRMHYKNKVDPYESVIDAVSRWPETATSVAVKLENGKLRFLFCYGIDDLVNLIVRPTPEFRTGRLLKIFKYRVDAKKWLDIWPGLKVELK